MLNFKWGGLAYPPTMIQGQRGRCPSPINYKGLIMESHVKHKEY